ncbi:MAG: UDP-N-acetylmuramoyl-tripeptide--D-alanyl-D-alanine ligase [Verrucomicrobiales bacterium]|jgi:UDP-N-acetylmuramoyl-tripeptide--D-alanyl-D-alanine ligase|nr:UDP-N-acetylmuramoyl-tripeptide--D-alanyl-D-alanine ligase [Verrucomicrobiales bacterium]
MKSLPLGTISSLAGGKLVSGQEERHALRVSTDTRSLQPGDLFIALRGENFDGHNFIEQAIQKGAVGALVEQVPSSLAVPAGFGFIEVDDVLAGLQRLAKNYRETLKAKIVAITGSNGKTSTKEFVAAVLSSRFKTHRTTGNLNNHIGVPLTVLGIDDSHEYAVVEMGMNHPGELEPLTAIARPDFGIITNVGWAHIEAFDNREGIAREKARVIECLPRNGLAILGDDSQLTFALRSLTKARVVVVGTHEGCQYRIEPKEFLPETTRFLFAGHEMSLPLAGWHMAKNASLAAALGAELGFPPEQIASALAAVHLPGKRLAVKKFRKGYLLDDTYNASPDSMLAAFQTLVKFPGKGRNVALLGSMGELGRHAAQLHREIGAAAVREGFGLLLAYGPNAADIIEGANGEGLDKTQSGIFTDHAALTASYWQQARADDRILVKGSRSQKMECVVQELERLETTCCIS